MAIAILATDTWIQHLPFVGGQRPSIYGPVDGIFYGLVAGDGDASGGNLTLNGRLSFDRKEDWVYVLGGLSTSLNIANPSEAFVQINTGPLIPTAAVATVVQNPSFSRVGTASSVANNNITSSELSAGGAMLTSGMPIFGDKRIDGIFLMAAAGWAENNDGATYQMSMWGFLIEYQSFFRNRPPSFG